MHAFLRVALFAAVAAFLAACGGTPTAPPPAAESKAPTAAESLVPAGTPVERTQTFVSPVSSKTYRIDTVKDGREEELREAPAGSRDVIPPATPAPPGDSYMGTARKAAKLSIATAATETFADLNELILTLPAKSAMVHHTPAIATTPTSNRVKEEKRNVRLLVFLYAASHEDDNDFHLILGRAPSVTPAVYFTAEVSGLPPASSASYAQLKSARNTFKTHFGLSAPGSGYDFYSPPIPLSIEGSLFFDMSHATGTPPGPPILRPKMPVIWEIHPVTKIVFEP